MMLLQLITNEMVNLVKNSIASAKLLKLDLSKPRSFYVGRCKVFRDEDGNVSWFLCEGFDKEYGNVWKSDVGGVLAKELKKKNPDVYELVDKKFKALLVRISPVDAESIAKNGLLHISDGLSLYTIIRIIKPDGSFGLRDFKNDYDIDNEIEEYTEVDEDMNDVYVYTQTQLF